MKERGWFLIAIIFLVLWVLSEISDRTEMADFRAEVHNFHVKGERFTAEDGRNLKAECERRMKDLEARCCGKSL